MKRTTRTLILFLISLLLTGCFAQAENPKQPQGPTPEELAAQELAKKTAEREALETQNPKTPKPQNPFHAQVTNQ